MGADVMKYDEWDKNVQLIVLLVSCFIAGCLVGLSAIVVTAIVSGNWIATLIAGVFGWLLGTSLAYKWLEE